MPLNTDENTPTIRKCQHGDVAPRMHVTPTETYETPMKAARKNIEPLENFQKQQAQKLDSIVIMLAREVSQARVYEEQQPWKVILQVELPRDATLASCVVHATSEHTPNQVKKGISTLIGVKPELLKCTNKLNAVKPNFDLPLEQSEWQDDSLITCQKLETPISFDTIGVCMECGDLRHLWYGYAREDPAAEPVPVIELCADCSNQLQQQA